MSIGSRWPKGRRRLATVVGVVLALGGSLSLAEVAAAASATGPEGQTITVSKVDGLDPAGESVTIHGEGYDLTKGIYVVVCVNKGAGQQPTPCLGGADMEGNAGTSAWISSNPPSYGEGLAQPFDEENGKGSFDVTLTVPAKDQFTDCLDPAQAPNGCVVGTRADHTRTADRSADVLIPIAFAGAGGNGDDGGTDGGTGGAAGENGDDGGTGDDGTDGGAQGADGGNGGGSGLAGTGAQVGAVALAGAVLLGGGAAIAIIRRQRHEESKP